MKRKCFYYKELRFLGILTNFNQFSSFPIFKSFPCTFIFHLINALFDIQTGNRRGRGGGGREAGGQEEDLEGGRCPQVGPRQVPRTRPESKIQVREI